MDLREIRLVGAAAIWSAQHVVLADKAHSLIWCGVVLWNDLFIIMILRGPAGVIRTGIACSHMSCDQFS